MALPTVKYNWTAAFVAFCNNHPVIEISEAFGISVDSLEQRIKQERWSALRDELPLGTKDATPALAGAPGQSVGPADPFNQTKQLSVPAGLPVAVKQKFERLLANRELNLGQAAKLREYLDTLLTDLLTGKMEMEQIFHNKGAIVRTTRKVSPADLVNIATFARSIHDMTYKALGDTTAQTEKGQDGPVGANSGAVPQIIINLPSSIAMPRQQAAALAEATRKGVPIIDVVATVAKEEPAA